MKYKGERGGEEGGGKLSNRLVGKKVNNSVDVVTNAPRPQQ